MSENLEKFEQWCILELMGHRRLAGLATEQVIAGKGFIRIDIYEGDNMSTQFYSPESVYAITPTTEEIAKHISNQIKAAPINPWELRGMKELGAPKIEGDNSDEFRDDDDLRDDDV